MLSPAAAASDSPAAASDSPAAWSALDANWTVVSLLCGCGPGVVGHVAAVAGAVGEGCKPDLPAPCSAGFPMCFT